MEGVLGLVVIVLIIYGFIRLNNYAGDSLARKKASDALIAEVAKFGKRVELVSK